MEGHIRRALRHWGMQEMEITPLKPESDGRVIYRAGDMVLKGIPVENRPEEVIRGNAAAHAVLGGQHGMAPGLVRTLDGRDYVRQDGYWWYAMEHINGRQMQETETDLFAIGQLTRKLHALQADHASGMNESKARYYGWFAQKPFKAEFDALLDTLPDWSQQERCFVHTDVGPHNAMLRENGGAVFIDLDDAGQGSRYLDLGWPFIMEFVDFNHATGDMRYRFDLALAFLKGYYGNGTVAREEYDLIWLGAMQMHISYMQTYGPYAVDSLWRILRFGLAQKEALWQAATCGEGKSHV